LFPHYHVQEEHTIGLRSSSGLIITVDVFVSTLNLALEYQGEHHYHDGIVPYSVPATLFEARDYEKQQHCKEAGIILVHIPYWWKQGDIGSLAATIKYYAPHVPIAYNCDSKDKPLIGATPHIQQNIPLMNATTT